MYDMPCNRSLILRFLSTQLHSTNAPISPQESSSKLIVAETPFDNVLGSCLPNDRVSCRYIVCCTSPPKRPISLG